MLKILQQFYVFGFVMAMALLYENGDISLTASSILIGFYINLGALIGWHTFSYLSWKVAAFVERREDNSL